MRWPLLLLLLPKLCLGEDSVVKPDQFLPGQVSGTQILRPVMPRIIFDSYRMPIDPSNPDFLNLESDESARIDCREMIVDAGVELLSAGCSVTSSDPNPIGKLSLITDGDRTGDDGYYTDLAPGRQWVQIDLQQPQALHLIWIWQYFKSHRCYRDLVIQISNDPRFGTSTTVFNTDHDSSSGLGMGKDAAFRTSNLGRAIAFTPVTGRYVRLWSNGSNDEPYNHWIEVSVYGKPAEIPAK